ncbi:MAG: SDR family oxidoreductase [Polyangiaceae bacterium]|nr:SDR family oxidoreductase [Polyangiaceae bacterium]
MGVSSLRGKRCFLTGAASGIGRATAVLAGREGARLFVTDRDAEGLAETVALLRERGADVAAHRALDVSSYDAVAAFARDVHAEHGSMDVVMNIAGISVWGTVETLTHDQWRRVVDVNLMGPIHVIECLVPAMIEAGRGGHLVNVSSAAGLFGLPWHAAYSASKFGLRGVSEVLRFDLERHGIGVSLVCPGAVRTGLVETLEIAGVDAKSRAVARLRRRFVAHAKTPEQAAEAILRGVREGRYMVYTSLDVRLGHWLASRAPLPYELAMRALNRGFVAATRG